METRKVTRILIVDDHPVMREGLEGLLTQQTDLQVCGQADTIGKALEEVKRTQPDIIVLDLTLGAEDGVDLIGQLHQSNTKARILVLSMHDELLYAERLLSMGVQGYIMKQEASTEFLRALRKVAAGDVYVSQAVNARLLEQMSRSRIRSGVSSGLDTLTAREREVLALTGKGRTTREIAQELSMSEKTVDSHRRNIRDKLGLHTSSELLRYAFRWVADQAPNMNEGQAEVNDQQAVSPN
jgi:RNA polymerase sigma factor (sigma-70 family)